MILASAARAAWYGWQRCRFSIEFSAGKRSVGLNPKHPQGMTAARPLLERCDVFLTNHSPPVVSGLGVDTQGMLARKPDLIHAGKTGSPDWLRATIRHNGQAACGAFRQE